jgi:hypothetical protein
MHSVIIIQKMVIFLYKKQNKYSNEAEICSKITNFKFTTYRNICVLF